MIAAISSAKTMAKPALEPTCRINSTGSSDTMPKATAPVEVSTPIKFQAPDQTTAILRRERMRVDDGRHGVGGVVKSVDEFEAERDQHRDAEKDDRAGRSSAPARRIRKYRCRCCRP